MNAGNLAKAAMATWSCCMCLACGMSQDVSGDKAAAVDRKLVGEVKQLEAPLAVSDALLALDVPRGFIDHEVEARIAKRLHQRQIPFALEVVQEWREIQRPRVELPRSDLIPDPFLAHMAAPGTALGRQNQPQERQFFNRSVPRLLHSMQLGEPNLINPALADSWREFSSRWGYDLHVWTSADLVYIGSLLDIPLQSVLTSSIALQRWDEVRHIAALAVLYAQGGVYIGPTIVPPSDNGNSIDIASIVPMKNLALACCPTSRTIGGTSLLVSDSFVVAAQRHPAIGHLLSVLPGNLAALAENGIHHASYTSGTMFISRALSGPVTILPARHLRSFGIDPSGGCLN